MKNCGSKFEAKGTGKISSREAVGEKETELNYNSEQWKKREEELKEKSFAKSSEEFAKDFVEEYHRNKREKTNFYRNSKEFGETVDWLDKAAKKEGFDGIYINDEEGRPAIWVPSQLLVLKKENGKEKGSIHYLGEEERRVDIGKWALGNIKKLCEVDEKLTKETMEIIMKHEKSHFLGAWLLKKEREAIEGIMEEEGEKECSKEDLGKRIIKRAKEVDEKYYPPCEMQTELQRINADYSNEEDFIESEAKKHVVLDIIQKGFDRVEKISYDADKFRNYRDFHFAFIKPEIRKKIFRRMEELRQEIMSKYKEKYKKDIPK